MRQSTIQELQCENKNLKDQLNQCNERIKELSEELKMPIPSPPAKQLNFRSHLGISANPNNAPTVNPQVRKSPTEPGKICKKVSPKSGETMSVGPGTNPSSPLQGKSAKNKGKEHETEGILESQLETDKSGSMLLSPLQGVSDKVENSPEIKVGSSYNVSPHGLGSVNKCPDTVATLLATMQQQQTQLQIDLQNSMMQFMESQLIPNAKEKVERELIHMPPQQQPKKTAMDIVIQASAEPEPEEFKVAEETSINSVPVKQEPVKQEPVKQEPVSPILERWDEKLVTQAVVYIYPNSKTYNEMVHDPHFVRIPSCSRDVGQPLSFKDRAVGQSLHNQCNKTDGTVEWLDQRIKFDKDGQAIERGTIKQETPSSSQLKNKSESKSHKTTMYQHHGWTASGNPGGDGSDNSDIPLSDGSFDAFKPSKEGRGRTPWLRDPSDNDLSLSSNSDDEEPGKLDNDTGGRPNVLDDKVGASNEATIVPEEEDPSGTIPLNEESEGEYELEQFEEYMGGMYYTSSEEYLGAMYNADTSDPEESTTSSCSMRTTLVNHLELQRSSDEEPPALQDVSKSEDESEWPIIDDQSGESENDSINPINLPNRTSSPIREQSQYTVTDWSSLRELPNLRWDKPQADNTEPESVFILEWNDVRADSSNELLSAEEYADDTLYLSAIDDSKGRSVRKVGINLLKSS
ncbi:hypothetical protein GYMLUDRAFT_252718 [Collybiopsis luxurians FD-317 M1]|uniref:Uncharacterized protein n=1 Tax=Collybiopsis luxurians FD-317 M1 TaxID=944289 RepID=A0A0D0BZ95_9AGAR|nr:hypothetical protein GYMLUDRAFT_252718 [Collybiopsis luxurians FD-317 M1]